MNSCYGRYDERDNQNKSCLILLMYLAGLFLIAIGTAGSIILVYLLNGENWGSAITIGGGFATAVVTAIAALINRRRCREGGED